MVRRCVTVLVAAVVATGCEQSDDRQVQGSLDLPRGASRYVLEAERADALISGRVEPATAAIRLVDVSGGRTARVNVARGGGFRALLPDLARSGAATFTLTATSGAAEPWRTEIVVSRRPGPTSRQRPVRVPETDGTPPVAALILRDGGRVVSSVAPVRADRDAPIRLSSPALLLTALTRDEDGGTGRIRISLTYARTCHGRVIRRTLHFPPSEIARVRLAPGAAAPVERRRSARVHIETGGAGCVVRGKAWADATNAAGLESFSDQTRFVYAGDR